MIDGIVKQEAEGEYVSLHCYNNTSVISLSFFIIPSLQLYLSILLNLDSVFAIPLPPPLGGWTIDHPPTLVGGGLSRNHVSRIRDYGQINRAGKFLYRYQECIDPGPESNILMDHFLCFLHFDPVLLNFL